MVTMLRHYGDTENKFSCKKKSVPGKLIFLFYRKLNGREMHQKALTCLHLYND